MIYFLCRLFPSTFDMEFPIVSSLSNWVLIGLNWYLLVYFSTDRFRWVLIDTYMGGLALMVISPKTWEFFPFFMSTFGDYSTTFEVF